MLRLTKFIKNERYHFIVDNITNVTKIVIPIVTIKILYIYYVLMGNVFFIEPIIPEVAFHNKSKDIFYLWIVKDDTS